MDTSCHWSWAILDSTPEFLAQQGMQQVSDSFYSQGMSHYDIPLKTMFHLFWCVCVIFIIFQSK